tara:strand:+ start:44621 stop:46438 length:1818 start_codon:yes stop_codon:yes gene_type:complete
MQKNQLKFIFEKRLYALTLLILIMISIVIIKFFYIQIIQHNYFEKKSKNNSVKVVPIPPARGIIFDRNKRILAENKITHNLEIDPTKVIDIEEIVKKLSPFISMTKEDIAQYQRIIKNNYFSSTVPIKTNLTSQEVAKFLTNKYLFENIFLKTRLKRYYQHNDLTSHVVGYINRINQRDIKDLSKTNRLSLYKGSDHIGKRGIEQKYEHLIHGIPGFKKIEVDAKGNIIRTIERQEPIHGQDIQLSIDIELQKKAVDAFGNRKGALVALSPHNGEILAYVSQPLFNPNLFVNGIDHKNWNTLNNNKARPLLDRVTKGLYPPGSTIKPFIAIAGLENNLRIPPFQITDPGFFTMPNQSKTFRNWKRDGHGQVDMVKAIAVSSDTFFYGLGLELGLDRMNQTLKAYGFGHKTGIDVLGEKEGLIANKEWKLKNKKEKWYAGETVITAIGQGFTLVTPIQLANATAKIALPYNNNYISPHLLLNSNQLKQRNDSLYTPPPNKKNTMNYIKKGMEAVTDSGGTAAFLNNASYKIAAKTGTAQVFGLAGGEYVEEDLPEHLKDHALFIAYAPAKNPKLVVAIVVENGGSGGSAAGPIAKKVFDHYLLSNQ